MMANPREYLAKREELQGILELINPLVGPSPYPIRVTAPPPSISQMAQEASARLNRIMYNALMAKSPYKKEELNAKPSPIAPQVFPACMGDTTQSPTQHWLTIQYRDGKGNLTSAMHQSDKLWRKDGQDRDPDSLARHLANEAILFFRRRKGFDEWWNCCEPLIRDEITASLAVDLKPTLPFKPVEVEVMKPEPKPEPPEVVEISGDDMFGAPGLPVTGRRCTSHDPVTGKWEYLGFWVRLTDLKKWLDTTLEVYAHRAVWGPSVSVDQYEIYLKMKGIYNEALSKQS
jgi:hypothetical protein